MSTSNFCIQQRQQERKRLKSLLVFGFASSALLHGIVAYAFPRWSFESPKVEKPMELIIVDKPEPKTPPKPKIKSQPIVEPEPKPIAKPEPVKAKTPPPPVKSPEPIKAQTTPVKPTPKKVLTSPTPAPSQPIVSVPIEDSAPSTSFSNSFTANHSSVSASSESNSSNPGTPGAVAVGSSAPPRPEPSSDEGISCVSNCEPEYPAALEGAEGSAEIKLTVDSGGNVTSAAIANANSNSQLNRQALLAARQMKFSSPGSSSASLRVTVNFTVAGSEYDRAARQEQREREKAARERQEQETARQQQLERERQARQEQLERARQERLEKERQAESQQQPTVPNTSAEPKPLPAPAKTEVDPSAPLRDNTEMLRKFRERIEQHQQ